jgi:hypothetical protein
MHDDNPTLAPRFAILPRAGEGSQRLRGLPQLDLIDQLERRGARRRKLLGHEPVHGQLRSSLTGVATPCRRPISTISPFG